MKALVAQGGGPTAVINQSLAGVVLEARRFSNIESVYGACHGVAGISPENIVDLGQETTQQIELVAAMPGSALGSTRDKPDTRYCQEILRVCRRTESATSSISAAMIPPILCALSARRHARLATRCAVSTSRRPSTMT